MTLRLFRASPGARVAAAAWLAAVVALAGSAPAGAQTETGGAPTELWRTYPVDPHEGQAPLRAGNGSEEPAGAQRDPGATNGTDATSRDGAPVAEPDGEGAGEPAVLVAVVGVAVLLSGLLMVLAVGRRVISAAPAVSPALAGGREPREPRPAVRARHALGPFRRRSARVREPEPDAAASPEAAARPSVACDLAGAVVAAVHAREDVEEPGEQSPEEGAPEGEALPALALGYGSRVGDNVEGSGPTPPRRNDAGKRPAADPPASSSLRSDVEALRAKAHAREPAKELPRLDTDALRRKARRSDEGEALDDTMRAVSSAEKRLSPATDADVLKGKFGRERSTEDAGERRARAAPPVQDAAADPLRASSDPSPWDALPPQIVQREPPNESGFMLVRAGRAVVSKRNDIVMVVFVCLVSVAFGIAIALLLN